MADRLRVLVSAYACHPELGSEPGFGWGVVGALARDHDLWVLTEQEEFEVPVRAAAAAHPDLRDHARFFFIPKARHRVLRKVWPPSYYWFYRDWHRAAYRLARRLHAEVGFDVVHQLGMMGFREPGYLWKLDAPFVWGPVAGMNLVPWRFLTALGWRGAVYHGCRNLANMAELRLLRRPRAAAARADGGPLIAMAELQGAARRFFGSGGRVLPPQAPRGPVATGVPARAPGEPLRLVWSGLHVSRKALPLLLGAAARLPAAVDWELDILGNGPMTAAWQRRARRLGLADRCRWHGWLPRAEAVALVGRGHVFAFTSVSDCVASVVLEAMGCGVPLVYLDHCGCPDVLGAAAGIPVSVRRPAQAEADLAAALVALWEDEGRRRRMGEAAAARARCLTWESKAEVIGRAYERAVERWRKRHDD